MQSNWQSLALTAGGVVVGGAALVVGWQQYCKLAAQRKAQRDAEAVERIGAALSGPVEGAPVGNTALGCAAIRVRETGRKNRLYADPFAAELAGEHGDRFRALLNSMTPPWSWLLSGDPQVDIQEHSMTLCGRFFDDALVQAANSLPVGESGVRQVVILGAGLDTRALRLPWPAHTVVFELDGEQVMRYKNAKLAKTLAQLGRPHELGAASLEQAQATASSTAGTGSAARVWVSTDLAKADWLDTLQASGFRLGEPTVWLLEGMLFYLPPEAAYSLVSKLAAVSGKGSALFCNVTASIANKTLSLMYRVLERAGMPFRFFCDDVTKFLTECGWSVTSTCTWVDLAIKYQRWPWYLPLCVRHVLPPPPHTLAGAVKSDA